jgi:hypothetical protein
MKLFRSVAVTAAVLSGLALGIGSAFAQESKYDWKACQADIEKFCKNAKGDEKSGLAWRSTTASFPVPATRCTQSTK